MAQHLCLASASIPLRSRQHLRSRPPPQQMQSSHVLPRPSPAGIGRHCHPSPAAPACRLLCLGRDSLNPGAVATRIQDPLVGGHVLRPVVTRSVSHVSTSTEAECRSHDRPPFDLNLGVLLAGFAFESYNDPKATPETPQETDSKGCTTTYISSQFLLERFTGQLQVKMICATNCPAMDLWGTSDPYAVIQVRSGSAQTKTAWTTREPVWKQDLSLMIKASDGEDLEKEYLRVSLWDSGILIAPRRMGGAALPLAGLCNGERHKCNLEMDGPGGGATVYFEVQYKSFEQLAEEERKKWKLPSVADILPPQLLEAATVPNEMLMSLLPFLTSSNNSPTISSSEFVRSALQAFETPFPGDVDRVRQSSEEGVDLTPMGGQRQTEANTGEQDEPMNGEGGGTTSTSLWQVADAAKVALQRAGWWGPEGASEKAALGDEKTVGNGQDRPVGCIDLQNVPATGAEGELQEDSLQGQLPIGKSKGGRWPGVDPSSLLPSVQVQQRKERLKKELIEAGLAVPDADKEGETGGRVGEGEGEGAKIDGSDSSLSDIKQAVFSQTESLLGWLAVLGASKEASQKQGQGEGMSAQAGEETGKVSSRQVLSDAQVDELAEGMTEDQKQAMKDVFGRAETAVEAWAMLASSLGQQTFVKSDFEKIAFLDNSNSDTQLAVWRDLVGRRLVVAFRGTEQTKLKDLLTDIAMAPAGLNPERVGGGDFEKESMVHTGFLSAYDSVRAQVVALLQELTVGGEGGGDQPWHLFITGHSLGGALATLLTHELSQARFIRERAVKLTMYNYGSPRVGNSVFAEEYNARVSDSWRVVNHRDIIPTVPRLMGYRHVCCPVYLNPLPPSVRKTESEAQAAGPSGIGAAQEEDGYLGDVIGEATTNDLIGKFLGGDQQRLFDRLLQTEIAMLNALRDGSAISMHMEDFYYVALLKKVQGGLG